MAEQQKDNGAGSLLPLLIIWLLATLSDRAWFALDRSVPAWDQAQYLSESLNYWQALQHPQWFSGEWWTNLWLLSAKMPPLTYILTVPFLNLFGRGPEQATLIHSLFSAILIAAVYGLGKQLFNRQVGLWAAAFCLLLPGLYRVRLQFLLDYPQTVAVTLSFYCLTMWKLAVEAKRNEKAGKYQYFTLSFSFLWAFAFGLSFGLAILVKHTSLLFLLTPLVWIVADTLYKRTWKRLPDLAIGGLVSVVIFGPWASNNWLLILTSAKRATVDSAIAEGDPGLNTLDAWTYYWKQLPSQVSWPLLLVPLVGVSLYFIKKTWGLYLSHNQNKKFHIFSGNQLLNSAHQKSIKWLAIFWLGAYFLNSLNLNKDDRYVLPYLPVLAIFLSYGLTLWPRRWERQIRWGTLSLTLVLAFLNMWPVGGYWGNSVAQILTPGNSMQPYFGPEWPHQQVIAEMIETEPYLRSTLGVLPSTAEINQHNLNYYGALKDFQVYGRQVGTDLTKVSQDTQALSWFITKTGLQGSIRREQAQATLVQTIERGSDFQIQKSWILPDGSNLNLYHRQLPLVEVKPLTETRSQVQLERVILSKTSLAGVPLPVTYEWSGPWEQLQSGLVLLTWRGAKNGKILTSNPEKITAETPQIGSKKVNPKSRWLHDHGIGMGALHPGPLQAEQFVVGFHVTERMTMLPPAQIEAGTYTLKATYLNRKTGETYPLKVPPVTVKIEKNARATELLKDDQFNEIDPLSAPSTTHPTPPELDLVTQLRIMAANLPKGIKGLKPVFDQIARINQYDPIQDYTVQAEQALEYRLQREPNNLEWAYALAFSRVLQQKSQGAIAALERVAQLDAQNPYAHAYLAFVYLYTGKPKAAQAALKPALAINPNLPELQVLNGAAALMQGNLIQAWRDFPAIKRLPI